MAEVANEVARSEPYFETELLEDSKLRQGDVIRWEVASPPWLTHGLIITADCDIQHGKHGGILSYVPIVSMDDYVLRITLPSRIERYLRDKYRPSIHQKLRLVIAKYRQEYTEPLSNEALEEMLRSDPEVLMDLLAVPQSERTALRRQLVAYRAAAGTDGVAQTTVRALASVLAEMRATVGNDTPSRIDRIFEEVHSSLGDLPGDAFFLCNVHGGPVDGCVAYLRLVRELKANEVALVPKDLARPDIRARRISRLRSPFVYRLTQQLAQVFSDIGLPTAYETQRAEILAKLKDRLVADGSEVK